MYKDCTLVSPVTHEQAHEIAMQAVQAMSRAYDGGFTPCGLALSIVDAYKEAYTAIEGWYKMPPDPLDFPFVSPNLRKAQQPTAPLAGECQNGLEDHE